MTVYMIVDPEGNAHSGFSRDNKYYDSLLGARNVLARKKKNFDHWTQVAISRGRDPWDTNDPATWVIKEFDLVFKQDHPAVRL